MEQVSSAKILGVLRKNKIGMFDYDLIQALIPDGKKTNLYKLIGRLVTTGQVQKLLNGKFLFTEIEVESFEKANFVYEPSYVSVHSALSYYGIWPQFSFSITSVSIRKSRHFHIHDVEFTYHSIASDLFWGFTKNNNALIATREKALIDTLYLAANKSIQVDFDELDLSSLDIDIFHDQAAKITFKPFANLVNKLQIC